MHFEKGSLKLSNYTICVTWQTFFHGESEYAWDRNEIYQMLETIRLGYLIKFEIKLKISPNLHKWSREEEKTYSSIGECAGKDWWVFPISSVAKPKMAKIKIWGKEGRKKKLGLISKSPNYIHYTNVFFMYLWRIEIRVWEHRMVRDFTGYLIVYNNSIFNISFLL